MLRWRLWLTERIDVDAEPEELLSALKPPYPLSESVTESGKEAAFADLLRDIPFRLPALI
jgi:hypothetical protein